jgi:ribosomal protein S18 acetylase RimI-like enzyme
VSGLSIREAVASDANALVKLFQQLDPVAEPSNSAIESVLSLDNHNEVFAVGEFDGRVIATAQLVVFRNLVRAPRHRSIIESVVVDEAYRRQGVGKQLIRYLIGLAVERDCAFVALGSRGDREAAQVFYRALGFDVHGTAFVLKLDDPRSVGTDELESETSPHVRRIT